MLESFVGLVLTVLVLLGPAPLAAAVVLDRGAAAWPWSRRALAVGIAWFLLQAALALLLGSCGVLLRPAILAGEAVLAAAGGALLAARGRARRLTGWAEFPRGGLVGEAALVVALVGAVLLLLALLRPVTDYDSLSYHMPAIATWLQAGSFAQFSQWSNNMIATYPYSWEAISALFVAPFGEDLVVAAPNFVAWVLLALGVFALGRELGASRDTAAVSAALAACIPLVLEKLNGLQVDLALAAFFVAGLVFAITFLEDRSAVAFALACASAALVCGVKMSGLAYAAILMTVTTVGLVQRSRGARAEGGGACRIGALLAGTLLVGGFWYARNLIRLGNPLGMTEVRLGPLLLFPGVPGFAAWVRRTTLWTLFDAGDLDHWRILLTQVLYRLGVPFVLLAVLAVPALVPRRRAAHVAAAGTLLACALLYWVTPMSGDGGDHGYAITPWIGQALRYAFPFMGVLGGLAAVGMSRLRLGSRILEVVLLGGVAGSAGARVFGEMLASGSFKPASSEGPLRFVLAMAGSAAAVVALRLGAPMLVRGLAGVARAPRMRPVGRAVAALVAVVAVSAATSVVRDRRAVGRVASYGRSFAYLESALPPGEPVGYVLGHRAYPLFGTDLERPVRWVPAEGKTREAWTAGLRRDGVCTVVAGPVLPDWERAPVLAWLSDRSGPFTRVCEERWDDRPAVFRLGGCVTAAVLHR